MKTIVGLFLLLYATICVDPHVARAFVPFGLFLHGSDGSSQPWYSDTRPVPAEIKKNALNLVAFGADPTGNKDSSTALFTMLDTMIKTHRAGYVSPGTYRIDRPFDINRDVFDEHAVFLFSDAATHPVFRLTCHMFDDNVPCLIIRGGKKGTGAFITRAVDFAFVSPPSNVVYGKIKK